MQIRHRSINRHHLHSNIGGRDSDGDRSYQQAPS